MAKKNSKTDSRSSQRPRARVPAFTPQDDNNEDSVFRTKLEHQIETERARLTKAEACLDCLRAAIEYIGENDSDCELSDLGYVADIARDLVHETLNRLDSVELDYPDART